MVTTEQSTPLPQAQRRQSLLRAILQVQAFKTIELPLTFISVIIQARFLAASQFGLYTLATSVMTIGTVLLSFGGDEILQRQVAVLHGEEARRAWARSFTQRVLVSVCALTAAVVLTVATPPHSAPHALAMPTALVLALTQLSSLVVALGSARYTPLVPAASSLSGVALLLGLVFIVHPTSAPQLMWLTALSLTVRCGATAAWLVSIHHLVLTRPRRRHLLLDTPLSHARLMVSNIVNQALGRQGDIVIAGIVGISRPLIGSYGVAFSLSTTANTFLVTGLGSVGLTAFARAYSRAPSVLGHRWRSLLLVTAAAAVLPLAVLMGTSHFLATWLFNDKYPRLALFTTLLVSGTWLARMCGGGTNLGALIASGREHLVMVSTLLCATANILLDFLTIPFFGMTGAAISTTLSLVGAGVLTAIGLTRATGARPPFLLYGALSALMVGIALLIRVFDTSLLQVTASAGIATIIWAAVCWPMLHRPLRELTHER